MVSSYKMGSNKVIPPDFFQRNIYQPKFLSGIPQIIRWLLAIPVAFLLGTIVNIYISTILPRHLGITLSGDMSIFELIIDIVEPVSLILISSLFVPNRQVIVSIIVSLLYIFTMGSLLMFAILVGHKVIEPAISIGLSIVSALFVEYRLLKYSRSQ